MFAPVHGEFLIMRPLVSETIPDNVTATQNALGLPVVVGFFQRLALGFVDADFREGLSGLRRWGLRHPGLL